MGLVGGGGVGVNDHFGGVPIRTYVSLYERHVRYCTASTSVSSHPTWNGINSRSMDPSSNLILINKYTCFVLESV